jgi:UDP-perosamine 4-acetyltransferase
MPGNFDLLIVGAGGHAKVIIELARAAGWSPVGLLDPAPVGTTVLGVPVVGDDSLAPQLFSDGHAAAFVALGRNELRRRIGMRLRAIGFRLPTLVHPSAVLSPSAELGEGIAVLPQAFVHACAQIGDFSIINTAAVVEHDCIVDVGAHVAPRSVLGGNVTLGEEVFFGIGAVARPLSKIGPRTTIGAGGVVVGEIAADVVAVGVPARPVTGK